MLYTRLSLLMFDCELDWLMVKIDLRLIWIFRENRVSLNVLMQMGARSHNEIYGSKEREREEKEKKFVC